MASGNDLIRDITERVVRYIDTPKQSRKESQAAKPKETWQYRWFGMMPVTLNVWKHKLARRKHVADDDDA